MTYSYSASETTATCEETSFGDVVVETVETVKTVKTIKTIKTKDVESAVGGSSVRPRSSRGAWSWTTPGGGSSISLPFREFLSALFTVGVLAGYQENGNNEEPTR